MPTVRSSRRGCCRAFLSAALLLALRTVTHAQFATNLIVNPGAEDGPGSTGGIVAIPGWDTAGGGLTVVRYGTGKFPAPGSPGPDDRGDNFFSGGPLGVASTSATQTIDVSAGASAIDAGSVDYVLSGFLGGLFNLSETATVTTTFLDGASGVLASATIGPVNAADRDYVTGLVPATATGSVPAGTRRVGIVLAMHQAVAAAGIDGYADSLSLVLFRPTDTTTTTTTTSTTTSTIPPQWFPDFSTPAGLGLFGDASLVTTADGAVVRLAAALPYEHGWLFARQPLDVRRFSTAFSFRIGGRGGVEDFTGVAGADGLVFVINPTAAAGNDRGPGPDIGYGGLSSSVGIEFDTYANGFDPDSNHLGLDVDGQIESAVAVPVVPSWDDGNRWWVWIDYDGATLEVRASQRGDRPATPLLSRDIDIPGIIGRDAAFLGFTSSTGSAWGNHDLLSWTYANAPVFELCENGADDDSDTLVDRADPDCATRLAFDDFSTTGGLVLDGAVRTSADAPFLRLTPAARDHVGSVFTGWRGGIDRFSARFAFRIADRGGIADRIEPGGDGLVFVVQGAGPQPGGDYMGFGGISPSVGVEFDTYQGFGGERDPDSNHLGLGVNGSITSEATAGMPGRWDDGQPWYAWVDYDGTTLEVRTNRIASRPALPQLSRRIDIPAIVGEGVAFVGFTASTGLAWGAHDVLSWTFGDRIEFESCSNARDDDADDLVDCDDPECAAAAACPGRDDPCRPVVCRQGICVAELRPGAPCAADDDVCTTDACDGEGVCRHALVLDAGCAPAAQTTLRLKTNRRGRSLLDWRWRGREPLLDVGNPAGGSSFALCVLDGSTSSPTLRLSARTGGRCGRKRCWRATSGARFGGFAYADQMPDEGLRRLELRLGPAGKGRIAALVDAPRASMLGSPAVVRLQRLDAPACWDAVFEAPTTARVRAAGQGCGASCGTHHSTRRSPGE